MAADTDQTTQTPTPLGRKVTFLAEKIGYRIIRQSWGEIHQANGNVRKDPAQPEVDYQFVNHALTVREGQDMLADKVNPETGDVETQDAVEFIRSQDNFGTMITEVPRDADAPDPGPVYAEIARLAAQKDFAGIKAIGDREFASFRRESILTACRAAMDEIEPPPQAA